MLNSDSLIDLCALTEALDAHLENTYAADLPGAALLVSVAGEVVYERGIGIANLQTGQAITPDTTFRLASVSKQFTAMSVQMLAQQGLLRYSDTLQHFFSELPAGIARQVTLQHLLCHTSGLPDYEYFVEEKPGYQVSDQEVLAITSAQEKLLFSPGSQFRYSNTGYVLLALVVERVSGIGFGDFLEQRIFKPLGMQQSMLYDRYAAIPERALGYAQNRAGEFVLADQGTCTATKGDGCIYTSVRDYWRWQQARNAGKAPDLEQVYAPIPGYADGYYGMGWFFTTGVNGALFHTGNSTGFSHLVIRIPAHDALVACFTNRADNTSLLSSLINVLGQVPALQIRSSMLRDLQHLTR